MSSYELNEKVAEETRLKKVSIGIREIERELIADTDSEENVELDIEEEENDSGEEDPNWRPPHRKNKGVHKFTGRARGLRTHEAITKDYSPLSVFMLYFAAIIPLLVEETNRYYHQFLDKEGPSPLPDITDYQMYLFLAIIIQMGHDVRYTLKDYWSTFQQFHTPFFGNTMSRDRFLHILHYLHFTDNSKRPEKDDENYDRLWKMRTIFDLLNEAYSKFYIHLSIWQ